MNNHQIIQPWWPTPNQGRKSDKHLSYLGRTSNTLSGVPGSAKSSPSIVDLENHGDWLKLRTLYKSELLSLVLQRGSSRKTGDEHSDAKDTGERWGFHLSELTGQFEFLEHSKAEIYAVCTVTWGWEYFLDKLRYRDYKHFQQPIETLAELTNRCRAWLRDLISDAHFRTESNDFRSISITSTSAPGQDCRINVGVGSENLINALIGSKPSVGCTSPRRTQPLREIKWYESYIINTYASDYYSNRGNHKNLLSHSSNKTIQAPRGCTRRHQDLCQRSYKS